MNNIMNNNDFWKEWYYRDDEEKWVHDAMNNDFQWMIKKNPNDIDGSFKNVFIHHKRTKEIIELAWKTIKSLPVRDEEKGLQNWMLTGIICNIDDINRIEIVFYESNFDIYRETHLILRLEESGYSFVNFFYENA